MSTPSHPENVPLNDTPAAKGLAPDPLLQAVAQLDQDAQKLGLSRDEAQARAWAGVNKWQGPERRAPTGEGPQRGSRSDISVGG